ncbi:MAG: hypothetical protein ACI85O_003655 [Saprospiraceae bacterium]|jgi:hypothetical protein
MYWISFVIVAGIVQQRELKFLFFGILRAITNFLKVPVNMMNTLEKSQSKSPHWQSILRYGKLVILPSVIVVVFFQLYFSANLKFAEISTRFAEILGEIFTFDISIQRVLFFLLGLFVIGMLLYKTNIDYFKSIENKFSDSLQRHRKTSNFTFGIPKVLGLKQEYQVTIILLGLLNVLLFVVNLLDVRYVWFDTTLTSPQKLSVYIHKGTYVLITSVLFAAGVLLYHFRNNLNFYPDNYVLRQLAYAWIVQNAILATSVAVRNWRHVAEYGFAYKRIGVFIFLVSLIIGLVFLYLKIKEKRGSFYLLRRNSWAIWGILLFASTVNWDMAITKFNLSDIPNNKEVDLRFLAYTLSDKNLYYFEENSKQVKAKGIKQKISVKRMVSDKRQIFQKRTKNYSWLSWNYADYKNRAYRPGKFE